MLYLNFIVPAMLLLGYTPTGLAGLNAVIGIYQHALPALGGSWISIATLVGIHLIPLYASLRKGSRSDTYVSAILMATVLVHGLLYGALAVKNFVILGIVVAAAIAIGKQTDIKRLLPENGAIVDKAASWAGEVAMKVIQNGPSALLIAPSTRHLLAS